MSIELEGCLGNSSSSGGGGGGSTTGANLLDIKTMAVAVADKGWACLSKTSNFLSKDVAPTLYNDMVAKLEDADTGVTSLTSGFSKDNHELICLSYINNKLYFIDESSDEVYYSNSYLSDGSAIQVNDISNARNMFGGNNCLIVVCGSGNSNKILKINPTDNSVIELGTHDTNYNGQFKLVGNKIYFFPLDSDENAQYTKVYEFVDDETDNTMVVRDYSAYVVDIEYYNGYYYLISVNTNVKYILKGLSLNNLNLADSSKWELLATATNGEFQTRYAQLFFVNNMCIMFATRRGLGGQTYFCYDIDAFTLLYSTAGEIYGGCSKTWFENNTFYFWSQFNMDTRPDFKYCSVNDILDYTNWENDSEISALNIDGYFSTLIQPTLQLFGLKVGNRKIYSRGVAKTTYTDTYVIDGTSVSVNYYKSNDTKIVTDFSQITAMATIGNYLGYSNYFFLSQATGYEGVTLPYNSNLWTYMYVGDDYVETNIPTGNATRLLPQAEIIEDDSASVSLDVKGNKDYQLSASALTALTLSSCEDSQLGTTIRFTSGATATTITDSASIDWVDGATPIPSASVNCLIFIWNKIGFYKEW